MRYSRYNTENVSNNGALDGGGEVPMSHVDFKKQSSGKFHVTSVPYRGLPLGSYYLPFSSCCITATLSRFHYFLPHVFSYLITLPLYRNINISTILACQTV